MEDFSQINLCVDPKDIAFINKIFEGFDNLALVTTFDNKKGLIRINVTPDTKEEALRIINSLPIKFSILK